MSRKKGELPGWFPFALTAAGLVALGAGAKAGWKLSGSTKPPSQPPPLQQGGVLQDWGSGVTRFART